MNNYPNNNKVTKDELIPAKLVVFDIETTGLWSNCEVLQIAACSDDNVFNEYILPSKKIPQEVTKITGLKIEKSRMFHRETLLNTVPLQEAYVSFLQFLRNQGNSVILVAHNGFRFDCHFILRDLEHLNLLEEFKGVVKGFADSLYIFRSLLPQRKKDGGKFTLQDLAKDVLQQKDLHCAHNAIWDVKILQQLIYTIVDDLSLIHKCHTKTILELKRRNVSEAGRNSKRECQSNLDKKSSLTQNNIRNSTDPVSHSKTSPLPEVQTAKLNINKRKFHKDRASIISEKRDSLEFLINISPSTKCKIVKASIEKEDLYKAVLDGFQSLHLLLSEDCDGKPRVTKNEKIIQDIYDSTQKCLENEVLSQQNHQTRSS